MIVYFMFQAIWAHGFNAKNDNSNGPPCNEILAIVCWFGLAQTKPTAFLLISPAKGVCLNYRFCVETVCPIRFFHRQTTSPCPCWAKKSLSGQHDIFFRVLIYRSYGIYKPNFPLASLTKVWYSKDVSFPHDNDN